MLRGGIGTASERHREHRMGLSWVPQNSFKPTPRDAPGIGKASGNIGKKWCSDVATVGHWGFRGTCCGVRAVPAMVQPEAPDHAETPPTKRRVISPSTSLTSKASSGSMSAPSPVQWPSLLPPSRDLEPALALAESMSPAVYSRQSTVDYTKDVSTPPTQKAPACRSVCTAAKTSASPPLAGSTLLLKRRPPATPASAATPLACPPCPPKAHAYAEDSANTAGQPSPPMPTAKTVPKPRPTAKAAGVQHVPTPQPTQPAPKASQPTSSPETTETPQSTPSQTHPAKDSHDSATVKLDSTRAGILRHKKTQPSGLTVKWELDGTPAPPVVPPDLRETPNSAPQAEAAKAKSPASAKAKAQPPATPAQPARQPAPQITVATREDGAPEPIEPASYNERQALQGEFKRRLRDPEANDIPDDVVEAWEAAVKNNTKAAKTSLFEKWLKAGKNWSLLVLESSKTHTDRTTNRRKMGWRTKAQVVALHGGDTVAADNIIQKKIAAGLVQDHPDDDELKTYYVTVELGKKDEEETANKLKMATNAKINCGGEASQKGQARRLPELAKEMPDEVEPALQWMVPQLLKDLGQAKMWPVKLAHLKHQDKLRDTLAAAARELEDHYYQLKAFLDQFDKDSSSLDEESVAEILVAANAARDSYLDSAAMATQLCKPKGGAKRKAGEGAETAET
eukprot:s2095_g3.t1